MRQTFQFRRGLLAVICAAAIFSGGCREASLTSRWRTGDIVVDGLYRDWTGLSYFDKPSMFIGARNDAETLYLIVKTVDQRAQWKVMRLGLTVWIEPPEQPGQQGRTWGVHYPVGLEEHGIPMYGVGTPDRAAPGLNVKIAKMLGTMEFLGPDAGRRIESVPDRAGDPDYGIRAAVRDTAGVIVYELKIPLRGDESHPYAAWAKPGERVKLRFVTGDIRAPERTSEAADRPDPNHDTSTGRIKDHGHDIEREQMRSSRRGTPMLNPLTNPIEFQAEITLAVE